MPSTVLPTTTYQPPLLRPLLLRTVCWLLPVESFGNATQWDLLDYFCFHLSFYVLQLWSCPDGSHGISLMQMRHQKRLQYRISSWGMGWILMVTSAWAFASCKTLLASHRVGHFCLVYLPLQTILIGFPDPVCYWPRHTAGSLSQLGDFDVPFRWRQNHSVLFFHGKWQWDGCLSHTVFGLSKLKNLPFGRCSNR